MTASLHIQFYLNKLLNIYKLLQGSATIIYHIINGSRKKVENDFTNLKDQIHKLLYQLRSTVQQKAKYANVQRNVDSIKKDIKITQKVYQIRQKCITYSYVKKYSEKIIRTNKTIQFNYRQQVYDLQQQLDLNAIIYQYQQTNNSLGQVRTLTNNLMDQDDRKLPSLLYMTQNQKRQNNKEIDQQLDIIIDGTKQLKDNSQQIGQKIDNTTYQIDNIINEVDETNQDLNKQQNQLQRIVQKYRQPNQFFLIFILIGLCRVIYLNLN
ncbi:unnamed protein product [Paramecium primaurelia]|uniref:t-SNARE coiled-coil homology domain-containing protein n=1 Tax=Paramecium primaurelia TaxID=5886 RepID=A0A8S1ML77_PARPR|nr:unnamed protein product [Paramecium primaurelia]